MALGIIGIEMFQTQTQGTLAPGQQLTLAGYTMTYDSLAEFDTPDGRNVARAVVLDVYKDGKLLGELYPRRDYYYASQQPMTIPGVRSTLEDDLYVLLVGLGADRRPGRDVQGLPQPAGQLVWVGGFVFILGTLVAAWPEREPEPARRRAPVRSALARV